MLRGCERSGIQHHVVVAGADIHTFDPMYSLPNLLADELNHPLAHENRS
jgi:hypothetical protein